MKSALRSLLWGSCWLLLATPAVAELIPTPSFSNHAIPTTEVPHTDPSIWQWVDVAILVVALILASYFALVRRSRRGLLVLSVTSLIWFGFIKDGCVCSVGSLQNVVLALADPNYLIPLSVVCFFALPLVFTLFFGRTFCASVCPLGAVQELLAVRTIRVPRWLDHALGMVPYLYLGAAVVLAATGTGFVICRYDPFVAFFRLGGNANMLIFGTCMLAVSIVVGRPYCRYLCPYGALLGLLSRVSKWHLRIVPGECITCRLCEDACPYGAIHPPTVAQSTTQRLLGRKHLLWMLGAVPVIVAVMAGIGAVWATPLSRLHSTVALAEQVRLEELGEAKETTDASDAYRNTGQPLDRLYQDARGLQQQFVRIGIWLGAWVGIVLSVKMVSLSLRRRRTDYHPQQMGCVSCGRCFKSCPVELVRLGLIQDVSEVVKETSA